MTFPEVYRLFEYWCANPPENEMLAMLARVYTTWKPPEPELARDDHQKSLEARWNAGAMNAEDMLALFKHTGGRVEGVAQGPMR
jgi:hypothetical protein